MLYRLLYRLVLRRIDAEAAHALAGRALRALTAAPLARRPPRDPALRVRALGLTFPSPLGVAAGLDKDATWLDALGALGFGFVEVGTITARAQPGNPRPRITRLLGDRALLNSMGFPNAGAHAASARLRARRGDTIAGVNIGKSKVAALDDAAADYRAALAELAPHADYLVLNVSSPNTPELRRMQATERLEELVAAVRAELRAQGRERLPLLVKIAPDLTDEEIDAVADLAVRLELDGLIAVNTTIDRGVLRRERVAEGTPGGISGAPLKPRALEVLRRLRARVGDRLVLVSVGGIETPDDAWERILAGATLVQAYTAFVYAGPLWPRRMNRELARRTRAAGAETVQELVGGS